MEKISKTVNLFEWLNEISAKSRHFSLQNRKCKKELSDFLTENNFFEISSLKHTNFNETLSISKIELQKIEQPLYLWIRSYGVSNDEKLILLINRMCELVPRTGSLFANYIENNCSDSKGAWILADYLCFILKTEIIDMSEVELDTLASQMDKELPLNAARLFSNFLVFLRENRQLSNGWTFHFKSRRAPKSQDAYTALDFIRMAYIIFNDNAWEKEQLLKKALKSKRHADLWLFVSLHFICAWRKTDLLKVPMPKLPISSVDLRKEISMGNFNAENILKEFEWRVCYASRRPHKTEGSDGISELKLFVPESLRKPIGIILTVSALHHEDVKPGGCFIKPIGEKKIFNHFLAKIFLRLVEIKVLVLAKRINHICKVLR